MPGRRPDVGDGLQESRMVRHRRPTPLLVAQLTPLLAAVPAALLTLLAPLPAAAQIDCWAPQEDMDSARDRRFATQLAWMKAAEQIIRGNTAFMAPPEPVRMRTTASAGPLHPSARLYVRAYPEKSTVGIQVWTGKCDVIPQAERIAASIGQIDVFFNEPVKGMFLQTGVPKFEGMVGGYPRYNGWVIITRGGRLPWIPQTLGDRLEAEAEKRRRALADWRQQNAAMKAPDAAKMEQAAALMRRTDPAAADKLLASIEQIRRELDHHQRVVLPPMTAQLEKEVADLERYRASFSAAELAQPAIWTDSDNAGRRQLEQRVRELNKLTPEESESIRSGVRRSVDVRNARREAVAPLIRDATAQYELAHLKPGPAAQAMAFKPDPGLPDAARPDKLQLIAVTFSRDTRKQRGPWMQAAQETFDFAALAAMLDGP